MIEQLRQIYKDALVHNYQDVDNPEKYEWFIDQNQQLIGIKKDDLTENEIKLLLMNFTRLPNYLTKNDLSEREQLWYKVLFQNKENADLNLLTGRNYRYIFFHIDNNDLEHGNFREALQGLFSGDLSIVWTKPTAGVMIEEDPTEVNHTEGKKEIIDTLTSDFFMNISMYIGPLHGSLERFLDAYSFEHSCFTAAKRYLKSDRVYSFENILPYLYIKHMEDTTLKSIVETALPTVQEDRELLQTIKTYIESNLNISFAAKKLYVHRNTLQYRIDKFIEKTGIDIKQMQGAFSIYLGLLTFEYLKDK